MYPILASSILNELTGSAGDALSSLIGDSAASWISDGLQWVLNNTIFRLLYVVAMAACKIIDILYSMFEVMAGLVKVSYDGDKQYLINIFFGNSSVTRVYWGMALIGFVFCFVFTIIAVIRKMFDLEGKMQQSLSVILTNAVKSIIIIGLMSAFITAILNMSNLLIQQVSYVFNNSEDLGEEATITYTDEEYAAMARVLNTIGNYSLNSAWTSRYNINSCFNDFREDLEWLNEQGVFDVYYNDDKIGFVSWQSVLQRIVNVADPSEDLPLNTYNQNLTLVLEDVVAEMQTDKKFKPLESYKRGVSISNQSLPLDRILFLTATMGAANNDIYNQNASYTDALRGPYYTGEKSIYNLDQVSEDFNIGFATDYVLLFLLAWIMLKDLAEIIFTCVSRIFNMILLYLISPPLIAATPLDGGNKVKQWTTAMIIQSFGVFGTIISMRIMMLLLPIMLSGKLVLFDNTFLDILGRVILVVGILEVEKKAQGLITGILADNAGWQAINAGDMKDVSGKFLGGARKVGGKVLGTGYKAMKGGFKMAGMKSRKVDNSFQKDMGGAAGGIGGIAGGSSAGGIGGSTGGGSGAEGSMSGLQKTPQQVWNSPSVSGGSMPAGTGANSQAVNSQTVNSQTGGKQPAKVPPIVLGSKKTTGNAGQPVKKVNLPK